MSSQLPPPAGRSVPNVPQRAGFPTKPVSSTGSVPPKPNTTDVPAAKPTAASTYAPVQAPAQKKPASLPANPASRQLAKKPAFSSKKPETPHGTRQFLFDLLDDCGANGVSDLHVHPNKAMWRLTSGELKKHDSPNDIITEEEVIHWMEHSDGYEDLNVDDPEKLLGEKGHTTVAFDTGTWRIRGSFRRSTVGISATFRLIPSKIPTVEDVYLPDVMVNMVKRKSGLILIEGPTGSGKTTSIAALIDYINKNTNLHIYSIEDPIEFHHTPMDATVFTMREIGLHASDYPSAVENALRSKPNIIFVGEMLNNETKKAALHAATTGHLVITTAHAGSVTEAIDSFIGGFNADEQPQIRGRLAQSLLGVMCQSLVKTKEGSLVAAREVMLSNLNFAEIIQDGKMNMLHAQMASSNQCFTLEDSLVDLVKNEVIEVREALESAKRPEVVKTELERLGFM
jgi:twitching motility protein PilT